MLTKAFRLFVSSTFIDFAAERELLQSEVFPRLDAYCAALGCQFQAIDLRWGVNEEAQLDHRTAEICLGEVRAAKGYPPPNFLMMLGDRYGWVPLPYAIARDEFEAIVGWLKRHWRWRAAHALLRVYQLDENHLVAREPIGDPALKGQLISAYTLRSREDEIPALKPADKWAAYEARLRSALQEAAEGLLKLGMIHRAARDKFFLSLTEQEIILGLQEPEDGSGIGATVSPFQDTGGFQTIVFIREIARTGDSSRTPLLGEIDHELRLEALRDRIKHAVPDQSIMAARSTMAEDGKLDPAYLATFADQVQHALEAEVDRHIARIEAVERSPDFALQRERAEHRAFGEQKRWIFVGRQSNLAAIARYVAGGDDHPLVVHGRSGFGKSALMASAIAAAESAQGAPVIHRFIGASASSADFRCLLTSLIEEMAADGIVQDPGELDWDDNTFSDQIRTLLGSISKPVVIFLDALDQLHKPFRVGWLPEKLPPAVKAIVSVLDDAAYETDSGVYRTLRQRLVPEAFLEIEPIGSGEGREILLALEGEARRRLQDRQRDYILARFETAGASPLYLRTAFEIARGWRSTDQPGTGWHVLAEDTAAIIAQMIADLSKIYHHEPELVSRTLGYLASAKNGLSAKELTDILSRDRVVMSALSSEWHGVRTDKLPSSVWVRLRRQLAPFLVEKRIDDQPLLQFFHRQVADVARKQHDEGDRAELHAALAAYFESRGLEREGGVDYDKRSLSELPYQLHHAQAALRLDQILQSPDWMQQKLTAFGPRTLAEDYLQYARNPFQTLLGRTLHLISGICERDERQLLPQLLGRLLTCTDPAAPQFLDEARRLVARPAILELRQSLTPAGAEAARLEGHTGVVFELAVLPDGRVASASADRTIRLWDPITGVETLRLAGHEHMVHTVIALSGGQLASGSEDRTIRLWDAGSGAETARLEEHPGPVSTLAELLDGRLASGAEDNSVYLSDLGSSMATGRLVGHTGPVHVLRILPDGRLASGSEDNTIRLWNLKTGIESARLIGHTAWVTSLAAISDTCLASGSGDCTIRLWDLRRNSEIKRLDGHTKLITALAALPDGRLVSSSGDETIRLWDVSSGTEVRRLDGHSRQVNTVAVLPTGRLASGSDDKTIRIWDLNAAGSPPQAAHASWITALTVLPDGRVISGSTDQTIRVWDPTTGEEIVRMEGHTNSILEVIPLPGNRLASGSRDDAIRIWDMTDGTETARLEAHAERVTKLAMLPDGRLASPGDDNLIRLWDVSSGTETARLTGHTGTIFDLLVLPDGRIASASSDHTVRLWDPKTSTETARLDGHAETVFRLTVLPDGRLASLSGDRTIRLWDTRSGAETICIELPPSEFNVPILFCEGLLATVGYDNAIDLWDTASGAAVARCLGHTSSVYAVVRLTDGQIATASDDRTIRLWHPMSGAEISRLEVDAAVYHLVVPPSSNGMGTRLVASDEIGRLHWLEILG